MTTTQTSAVPVFVVIGVGRLYNGEISIQSNHTSLNEGRVFQKEVKVMNLSGREYLKQIRF